VIGHLPHLHDQTKDVCIVVQHDTLTDIGIELSSRIGHNAAREIMFDLTEKFIVDDYATQVLCSALQTES